MKPGIHPKYQEATITCACGNSFSTLSVKEKLSVEACAKCHPFFTGKTNLLDIQGRVERFNKRYEKALGEKNAAAKDK